MTRYDDVAYPSEPLPQATPDRLVTQARLLGVLAPDPVRCRVLEIGCSDAGHLAWLAARAPESTFVGVDLSAAAVARGRAALGDLTNIELRQADLAELDAGRFDIVMAHGVLSWLPGPRALLACIDRHLAATGIAFVSYNVLPGAFARRLVGDPIRRWAASADDPSASARQLLEWIGSSRIDSPHAELVRHAARLSLAKPDHLLVHDEMAEFNEALYFDEFVAMAGGHDLAYLGECHLGDSQVPTGLTVPADLAARVGDDEVAFQQLLDYARNRAFRQTLVVRPGNAPSSYRVDPRRLLGMWLATPVQWGARAGVRTQARLGNDVEVTTDDADLLADLADLGAAWPGSLPVAGLRSSPETLLRLYVSKAVDLSAGPSAARMPGDRPLVDAFVRSRARVDGRLASLRHEPVVLQDDLSRAAVSLMDGSRSRAEIATALATRPGAPADPRRDLEDLIAGLTGAGMFLG